jgi:hypothetical protein
MRIENNLGTYIFVLTILLLVTLFICIGRGWLAFDNSISIGVFISIPLFLITILQLFRNQRIQQARYVKDFLNEFRRSPIIYEAYYDLIYSYTNSTFERVRKIAEKELEQYKNIGKIEETEEGIPEDEMPKFDCFLELNHSREKGSRFYHPKFFHTSKEETRLDGVLDYFNTVVFYSQEGLIKNDDIQRMLGDYLAVLSNRDVIDYYLRYTTEHWKYKKEPREHVTFAFQLVH